MRRGDGHLLDMLSLGALRNPRKRGPVSSGLCGGEDEC